MTNPFLSIIIPAHNEENRLRRTLGQVFDFLAKQSYSSEVLVIENASTDRTFDIAREFTVSHPELRVFREAQRGKGCAVQRGMLEARGEYRFLCDADLSMPIEELKKFLPPATDGFDIAIGSREAKGAVRYNEPGFRHWGGRLINLAIQVLILPGLNDTQCGFKCFQAEAATRLFSQQTIHGWAFDIEILYLARRKRYKIKEIPIDWYFDADSKVKAVLDALHMLKDIFRIRLNSLRGRYS
ncbi:MAG: glycosyl transferase [Chloroflexi bacterium RBG_16_51_16]|nr:MAG: glycosyl transferase [Chloroflexi bacterium RBG_16_51_16]